ncbi:MAG TPA: ABC transporter ATP-binding protein [Candidatus Limnocylindrales bacterium]|nr:ABC transporter ATP-binding protein [Candidatus Limnocylindrales bacterium]
MIASSAPVIDVAGLRKRYGRIEALADLTMTVRPGEVFGFLGPNGAGKTTTVKLLLGLARPSGGSGRVLGAPLGDREARRRIGYLPELFRYQPWLRAREVLALHADLIGMPGATRARAFDDVLGLVGLADRAATPVSGFSKGMQQRLGLGVALLGDPALVILDEPTSALDPIGRMDVRAILRTARDRGAAVFLNSHLLSEVERVCDRVAVVDRGKVVAAGALAEVLGGRETRIRATGVPAGALDGPIAAFGRATFDGSDLIVPDLDDERVPDLVAALVGLGARVHEVSSGRESLEQRFVELVGRGGPGPDPATAATERGAEPG